MTKDELLSRALTGEASRSELAEAIRPDKRQLFLDVCASIDRALTKTCRDSGDTCLADGCAMDNGEACLNACLKEGPNYYKAIAHVWLELVGEHPI